MTTPTAQQRVAAAIRATYRAGAAAGRWAWPHIHSINWAEARGVARDGLAVLIAATAAAALVAGPALIAASEALGRRYAALLVGTTTQPRQGRPQRAPGGAAAVTKPTAGISAPKAAKTPQSASQAPVATPAALAGLTVQQLRAAARAKGLSQLGRRGRRADLLAALA
jgi:hypothetical protein